MPDRMISLLYNTYAHTDSISTPMYANTQYSVANVCTSNTNAHLVSILVSMEWYSLVVTLVVYAGSLIN